MSEYIFVIIFGLLIGSFLNVCIYRIPKKKSISFPPSQCRHCNSRLRVLDLIPVFSYIFLRGKCRYCGKVISIRYPVVEILNTLLYLLVYWRFGFTVEGLIFSLLISVLIVISFIDYDYKIIPNGLAVSIFVLWLLYAGFNLAMSSGNLNIMDSALGFIIGGGFYLLIALITSGAMGGGDIKLMAVLGLFLGIMQTIVSIFLSFIIGAVFSIGLLAIRKKGRKDSIAFGPFIAIASAVTLLYGNRIIELYLGFLLK